MQAMGNTIQSPWEGYRMLASRAFEVPASSWKNSESNKRWESMPEIEKHDNTVMRLI
jgi:hypothetical protein